MPRVDLLPSAIVAEDVERICDRISDALGLLSGRRLLISGGAGFLGYYLISTIVAWNRRAADGEAVELTVWDNFARGVPPWLEAVSSERHVTVEERDITRPIPDTVDLDYVVHAAGIASPTFYRRFPIETIDANVTGLRVLLDHCRAGAERGREIAGLLFFSSSEIYGDPTPDAIPTAEAYRGNVSCTGPRACYDESKRFGETLCVNFARSHGVPVTIVRPFNNYGPGLRIDDERVIPDFARDILGGRDLVLLSDGSPTRTFCYVADAVCGYYAALTGGHRGEAYNIGVPEPEISIADLAERMAEIGRELFSYDGRVVLRESTDPEYLTDNPSRRCPDIAKARRELGYAPEVPLDEGLRRSLVWYADTYGPGAAR
jgi:nucleoside-diphosphate-sugar epimerase